MCGIAGIVQFNASPTIREDLVLMCDAIAHRGPDASGYWVSNNNKTGLGHRRLSIIDLSDAASQPMHFAEGRYAIVFNGEIYNYLELKEWLVRFKYVFTTSSDTEVLLALYDLKGEKCLEYLDGMFAFAIWDNKEQKLFCARDRFGEKPFFYFKDQHNFYFASEIKALLKVRKEITVQTDRLQKYINENYSCLPSESYFSNVHQLPASHFLVISEATFSINRYWEIDLEKRSRYVRTSQYYEQFYELFSRSVNRRLRSDVKVGSSLSGGLDSSAIVSCISELKPKDFTTLSARFPGAGGDEGHWIEEVVKSTGFTNLQVLPDANGFLERAGDLIYQQEYPIASTSVYAQWCVMKLAHDNGIKVLLDGQGADEFLAGYDNLKYFALWELYRKGSIVQFRRELQYFKESYGASKSVGLKFLYDPILQLFGKRRKVYDKGYTLRERLKYAMEFELPELLRYADRNSMGNSVEVRLPFLSHQLVEFAFSLPPEQIYQKGRTKYVLREATRKVLPKAIYNRKDKIGFAPPENSWMQNHLFKQALSDSRHQLINKGFQPGGNEFRNFVAAHFINVFS